MASFSLQPGQLVGKRYRLRQMIGVGGMGAVWSARDEAEPRDVAVKFLHPALLRDPLLVQRFVQEASLGAPLRHACIIETYASGRHQPPDAKEPIPYLVTELLDGEPLSDVLRRVGTLAIGPGLAIMRDVARAAHAAHEAGVLHRDLKPANVFLHTNAAGVVVPKVLDFGVSKALDPTLDVGLTSTGMLVGSPSYMSPEQALGKRDLDARSDVWAIGVMLHRTLTGKSLFAITGAPGMLKHIAEKDVTLDDLPGLPEEVIGILRRCLRRDRSERFASAADLADATDVAIAALGVSTDLGSLVHATVPADAAPVEDAPTVLLEREETETRLAVAVASGKPPAWSRALAVAAVAAILGTAALVLATANRAPSSEGSIVAATPSIATAVPSTSPTPPPEPAIAASSSSAAPRVSPTPVSHTPPAPARRAHPPVAPTSPSDVARRPGF